MAEHVRLGNHTAEPVVAVAGDVALGVGDRQDVAHGVVGGHGGAAQGVDDKRLPAEGVVLVPGDVAQRAGRRVGDRDEVAVSIVFEGRDGRNMGSVARVGQGFCSLAAQVVVLVSDYAAFLIGDRQDVAGGVVGRGKAIVGQL